MTARRYDDRMEFPPFVRAPKRSKASDQELLANATAFYRTMQQRRTIRDFSDRPVPRKVIEQCIRSAGTAPNGANLQPWHFVAISDPDVKREIRVAAEIEEKARKAVFTSGGRSPGCRGNGSEHLAKAIGRD
jgi:iodotyrosine deiodinase